MTIHINLLDWRAQRRERRRKQFLSMIGAVAVLAAVLALGVSWGINARVDNQQDRNAYLKQQITQADREIAEIKDLTQVRDNLIARMHVIEDLQQDRSETVHFFDELVATLPPGVYLTSVKQTASGSVTLVGVAESNARVSEYMKQLDASPWFDNPRLVVIKTSDKNRNRRSDFTLMVNNAHPVPPKQPGAEAGP
ncbi:MAG: hypothetical protein EPN72_09320 [Nevskiaceae bacterium]|nr:MAG: hypothetical protein EPN63_08660 [Nevskiaceae bacterium]TBR72634.1 MAG: hypothetical protein EPN72_09320 [Nevskiaceae bacterium]